MRWNERPRNIGPDNRQQQSRAPQIVRLQSVRSFRALVLLAAVAITPNTLVRAQQSDAEQTQSPADVIFFDGTILTGAHLLDGSGHPDDPSIPARVSAVAVANGRVLAVGSDSEVLRHKGSATQMVDLHGAFAMPGFNDAHTHLASAGRQRLTVDLDGTTSLAEMLGRIKVFAAAEPQASNPAAWIEGAGWDHTKWASKTLPTRSDLDRVTGAHPAMFYRTDGHIVVVNTAALAAAGITEATADPAGGKIDRDAAGKATGIVRESPAIALITPHIPPPDTDARRRALELAMADALQHGVTSVQDFSDWEDWLALESMEHTGKLKLRVSEWMDFNQPVAVLQQRRASHDANDPLLHLGMLKAFMDGSLGSRTAALAAPYSDEPANYGIPRYTQDKLNAMAAERAAAGFQLGFHAIGDEANHMALTAFGGAEQVGVAADEPRTPRNPDAAIVTSSNSGTAGSALAGRACPGAATRRLCSLSRAWCDRVHAAISPADRHGLGGCSPGTGAGQVLVCLAIDAGPWHPARVRDGLPGGIGESRFAGCMPRCTRQNEAGTKTYQPQERISLQEAIYAYTQGAAYAEFREGTERSAAAWFLCGYGRA